MRDQRSKRRHQFLAFLLVGLGSEGCDSPASDDGFWTSTSATRGESSDSDADRDDTSADDDAHHEDDQGAPHSDATGDSQSGDDDDSDDGGNDDESEGPRTSDSTGTSGGTTSTSSGVEPDPDTSTGVDMTGEDTNTSAPDPIDPTGDDRVAPTLPQANGACPTFQSGTQDIMGLETNMLVGAVRESPGPLLFTWHGTGSSGRTALEFQLPRSVRDDVVARGGIIIAPNDDGRAREGSSANGVWYETSDLEYADHIVACAVAEHNIDPRQIFVTGCSAGGLMAGAMVTKRANYVAAAFPNSGGLVSSRGATLGSADHTPAVLNMHGGSGDNVVINFGDTSDTLAALIVDADGFAVNCDHGSGHCGAPDDLQESAWDFVNAHPYGTTPSPYTQGIPGDYPQYCEIVR